LGVPRRSACSQGRDVDRAGGVRGRSGPDQEWFGVFARTAGGNVTGITNVSEELLAKRVELLKEALPSTTRIGVLGNMSNPGQPVYLKVVQDAARRLGMEAQSYPVEEQSQLAPAFTAMERDHVQALVLLPDAWFYPLRSEVVGLAAKRRLPAIYGNTGYADAGGLLVYGVNLPSLNVKVVSAYLDKILKGAKPGDLPSKHPRSSTSSSINRLHEKSAFILPPRPYCERQR
jgi:putative ABC transport system substrate-binding protein